MSHCDGSFLSFDLLLRCVSASLVTNEVSAPSGGCVRNIEWSLFEPGADGLGPPIVVFELIDIAKSLLVAVTPSCGLTGLLLWWWCRLTMPRLIKSYSLSYLALFKYS